jgi:hypothetical protein
MRSSLALAALSVIVASSFAVACAPSEEEDDNANDQTQNVTGGSNNVDSPTVYLFESADKAAPPKCAGALLSDKYAVTAKACAKQGMIIGRAADKDGRGQRAVVKSIKSPEGESDIAVVELDRNIGGVHAVITHAPLKEGYSVNGIADKDEGLPVIGTEKNGASSIEARMVSETDKYSAIVPKQGSEICAQDMGAPVCGSSSWKMFGYNVYGTCGLSGLVVGAPDAPAAPATTPAAPGATQNQPQQGAPANGCSANAWKVVQLGRHAAFLRELAPEAFKPVTIDKPILRNLPPYAPKDLWGFKTGGKVAQCKIETATLAAVAVGKESAKITAKVSFTDLQERATPYGRFGIALKSAPTQVRWLPAKALTAMTGRQAAYETQFEGVVSAEKDGEYIVLFRASASGGEDWTQCNLTGIDQNRTGEGGLGLKVGTGVSTDPAAPGSSTTPQGEAPASPGSANDDGFNDPSSSSSDDDSSGSGDPTGEQEDKLAPAKKKKKADSGCSAAPGSSNASTALPIVGVLLGLGAISRRRRKQ